MYQVSVYRTIDPLVFTYAGNSQYGSTVPIHIFPNIMGEILVDGKRIECHYEHLLWRPWRAMSQSMAKCSLLSYA